MALIFGTIFRLTKTSVSIAKTDGVFVSKGRRTRIDRISWSLGFAPTNAIAVWYGQQGNTTYDNRLLTATQQYFTMSSAGIFTPTPTVTVGLNLVLEADEQMWFEWTRTAETGVESFTIQGSALP